MKWFLYNKFLNLVTLKWTKPTVYGNVPVPRDGHSACIIQNCMYIFGGFQEHPSLFASDLYMLNFHSMVWSIVKTKVLFDYTIVSSS